MSRDVFIEISGCRDEVGALRQRIAELTGAHTALRERIADLEQLLSEQRSRAVHAAGGPLPHPEDNPDFPGCRI